MRFGRKWIYFGGRRDDVILIEIKIRAAPPMECEALILFGTTTNFCAGAPETPTAVRVFLERHTNEFETYTPEY